MLPRLRPSNRAYVRVHRSLRVTPAMAEHARLYDAGITVLDWQKRLVCSRSGSQEIDMMVRGDEAAIAHTHTAGTPVRQALFLSLRPVNPYGAALPAMPAVPPELVNFARLFFRAAAMAALAGAMMRLLVG